MTVLNHCLALLMLAGIVTGYTMPVTANNQVTGVYYSTPSNAAFQVPLSTMSSSLTTALADVVTIPNEALVIGFCGASNALTSVAALLLDDNGIAQDFVFKCTHIGLDTVVNNEDWLSNTYDDNVWTAPTNEGPADSVFNWPAGVTKPPWFTLGTPRMCCRYVFPFISQPGHTCCNPPEETWCFTCEAALDDCCIAIGNLQKCNADETCFHETLANGRSIRGCRKSTECPDPAVPCGNNNEPCNECLCHESKFDTDIQDRNVSFCAPPGWVNPWCIAWCYGDPHIGTCDGMVYSMNTVDCSHRFIRDKCVNGLPAGVPTFSLDIHLDDSPPAGRGWFAKAATIKYFNITLVVDHVVGPMQVNGIAVYTVAFPQTQVILQQVTQTFYSGLSILCLEFQTVNIRVYWDYRGGLSVWIPCEKKLGNMCGLAGDCDGNKNNDMKFGPSTGDAGCPNLAPSANPAYQPGQIATKHQMKRLGMSWYAGDTGSPECTATCNGPNPMD